MKGSVTLVVRKIDKSMSALRKEDRVRQNAN